MTGPQREPRQMPNEQQMPSPQQNKQAEMVKAAVTDMIYNPSSKKSIQDMLQSGQPKMTVPKTSLAIVKRFEDATTERLGEMPMEMKLLANIHTFQEVLSLATSMGLVPEELEETEVQPMLKDTLQQYIQAGLKDGSLDPIELQQAVEPMLSNSERAIGERLGQEQGVPSQVNQGQMNEAMYNQRSRGMRVENANLKKQVGQMTGALQGMAQAPRENR